MMYMQKKIYEAPALEVIDAEFESMLANSFDETLDPDKEIEESDPNDMNTQKKQFGFNNAPWE